MIEKKRYQLLYDSPMYSGKTEESRQMGVVYLDDMVEGYDLGDWILVDAYRTHTRVGYIKKDTVRELP